jgi:hypothetical protein
MSVQKVVNKNTNLVTNNVVSRGHLSSSVVPRTLTLGGTADAATAHSRRDCLAI